MAEESQSDAFSFVGAFYNTRNVCHHKTAVIIVADYTEIGFKSSECIIGNLRLGRCDCCEESRFPGIRKADEPDVRHELELKDEV